MPFKRLPVRSGIQLKWFDKFRSASLRRSCDEKSLPIRDIIVLKLWCDRQAKGGAKVRKIFAIVTILLMTVFSSSIPAADNTIKEGAKKVAGDFKEAGKSAGELGVKTGKAAKEAAKDTGSAFRRGWDDFVRALKKAFK